MFKRRVMRLRLFVLLALAQASLVFSMSMQRPARGQENVEGQGGKETVKFPGRIFLTIQQAAIRQSTSIAINPNDQTWMKLPDTPTPMRISLDGKKMLGIVREPQTGKSRLMVNDLAGETSPSRLFTFSGFVGTSAFWSADGKSVIVSHPTDPGSLNAFQTWKYPVDGSPATKLPIPATEWVLAASPDGRWLATLSSRPPWNEGTVSAPLARPCYLFHLDGTGERLLLEGSRDPKPKTVIGMMGFSPDSQTVLYIESKTVEFNGRLVQSSNSAWLVGIDGKRRRRILEGTDHRYPLRLIWSPDGKHLAVGIWEKPANAEAGFVPLFRGKGSVEIVDLQGQTERVLNLPEQAPIYSIFDWQ